MARHDKVAFELSGGRDSVAALYLMREYWPRITVYWLNTGDPMPETLEVIERVRREVPVVEIDGEVHKVIARFGLPSDIVPVANTPLGISGCYTDRLLVQDRYSCCARTIMQPMHDRVLADGNTLIVRGQKNSDAHKSQARSGYREGEVELLFPIEDWTPDQVDAFLIRVGAPVSRVYSELETTPDCLNCTAWWGDGRAGYLKKNHPEAYAHYMSGLAYIKSQLITHIQDFDAETAV